MNTTKKTRNKKVFSVMANGRNEQYILAENEQEAESKYVGLMIPTLEATPLDGILDKDDYLGELKMAEKSETDFPMPKDDIIEELTVKTVKLDGKIYVSVQDYAKACSIVLELNRKLNGSQQK